MSEPLAVTVSTFGARGVHDELGETRASPDDETGLDSDRLVELDDEDERR